MEDGGKSNLGGKPLSYGNLVTLYLFNFTVKKKNLLNNNNYINVIYCFQIFESICRQNVESKNKYRIKCKYHRPQQYE